MERVLQGHKEELGKPRLAPGLSLANQGGVYALVS